MMVVVAARSDAELIEASVDDPDAFGEIFERHHRAITAFCSARVGPDAGAELAAQVFVDAFRARARYEAVLDSALPWLYGFAANHLRRHHRTEQRRLRLGVRARAAVPVDDSDHTAASVHRADAERAWQTVGPAVADLPADLREPLLLHLWGQLTYDEVATALGVPIGTVRSRISRAKSRLRAAVDAAEVAGEGR